MIFIYFNHCKNIFKFLRVISSFEFIFDTSRNNLENRVIAIAALAWS